MSSRRIFVFGLLLVAFFAMVKADEYKDSPEMPSENQDNDIARETRALSEKSSKTIVEDMNTETSALVDQDESDPDFLKHKGMCHYGIAAWFKPGFTTKCGCLKCICQKSGKWVCDYDFSYCPYYYCGNKIYNPKDQLCCCGKIYTKRKYYSCCGYFYYYTKTAKCCSYYTVKPIKANCPKSTVNG